MAQILKSITDHIGNTPLVALDTIGQNLPGKLYAKLEMRNPGGSAKDRVALYMIEDAVKRGVLPPGGTIVEPTSGNTGIGLAAVAAARGYKAIIVMPDTMSPERRLLMQAYGAQVVLTPALRVCPVPWKKRSSCAGRSRGAFCRDNSATAPMCRPILKPPARSFGVTWRVRWIFWWQVWVPAVPSPASGVF